MPLHTMTLTDALLSYSDFDKVISNEHVSSNPHLPLPNINSLIGYLTNLTFNNVLNFVDFFLVGHLCSREKSCTCTSIALATCRTFYHARGGRHYGVSDSEIDCMTASV